MALGARSTVATDSDQLGGVGDPLGADLVPVFTSRLHALDDVLVAIPAYNEERFIGSVVHGVLLEGYRCLVVDDGSSDRTAEIAASAGAIVRSHDRNGGKAEAVATAMETAYRMGAGLLVVMDGDWQHDPKEIHRLVAPIAAGEADIVSGSRFLLAKSAGVPVVRGLGLRAMTAVTNMASGGRITDSQTGFHAFSRRALSALHLQSKGFAVEVEVQFMARVRGLRHVEVPVAARYTDPPKRNVVGQAARVLDGLVRLVAHYRPLLFFGVPGGLVTIAGVLLAGLVLRIHQEAGELATGYALLAVLLVIIGCMGVLVGLLLHVLRGIFLGLEDRIHAVSRRIEGQLDRH